MRDIEKKDIISLLSLAPLSRAGWRKHRLISSRCVIAGMYKGGSFKFTFAINSNYPHDPPKVKCVPKVSAYMTAYSVYIPRLFPLPFMMFNVYIVGSINCIRRA